MWGVQAPEEEQTRRPHPRPPLSSLERAGLCPGMAEKMAALSPQVQTFNKASVGRVQQHIKG